MTAAERNLRNELINTVVRMSDVGLNRGTSGNASVRFGERILITPSAVPYETLEAEDLVLLNPDESYACARAHYPSSEWRFHRDLLGAREDLQAVVHAHAQAAMAVSCLRREIPSFHYMVAVAGGPNIRCAEYETFGTEALSNAVLHAMKGRKACLMANHGLLAAGASLGDALGLAMEVESLADGYLRCLAIGEPILLGDAEMKRVIKKFRDGYGRSSAPSPIGDARS